MTDYGHVSFWLETSHDDLTPRAALDGSSTTDVAILGAGYTGLWTAFYLLAADPTLSVTLLESDVAGYGASGRNGGWCPPGLNISLGRLAELHGREAARQTYVAVSDAVDEVGRVAEAEHLDIDWHRGGQIDVARGPHEVPALEAALEELRRFDLAEGWELLDRAALAQRIDVSGATAGLATPDAAVLHPGKLVRQLARLVERMGATIYEQTHVTDFRPRGGSPGERRPTLITERGEIRAERIVLAGEVYLTRLRQLHRTLIPAWSQIVLSEPLPDSAWEQIGWQRHELIGSPRLTVVYLARTADGRILFGGRGAPYRFGSAIADEYGRHEPTFETLRSLARAWFPALRDIGFSHAWGGAVGMSRDWHPTIVHDAASGIASARGYIGHGVALSNLAGRTLAELILGRTSERTELPLVGHRSRSWEPEPLRWLGVRFVAGGIARVDARSERTGKPPSGRSIAERLARH